MKNLRISNFLQSSGRNIGTFSTVTAFLILVCITAGGCGSTAEVTSWWNNNTVIVDGKADEWTSHTFYVHDAHVSLGIRNDSENVYICVMSSERQLRHQMIGFGLTVWLQPEGGEKLGIHYPVGLQRSGSKSFDSRENSEVNEERDRIIDQAPQDVEVIGSDQKDRQLFTTLNIPGIAVKVGSLQGSAAYELRVPMKRSKDRPFALGIEPGGVLHLSVETGTSGPRTRAGEMKNDMGERTGRRGGRSPEGDQPPGETQDEKNSPQRSSDTNRPEPINFSATIVLARPQSDIHN